MDARNAREKAKRPQEPTLAISVLGDARAIASAMTDLEVYRKQTILVVHGNRVLATWAWICATIHSINDGPT